MTTQNLDNPFPGMNPWLESHWQSVHARFLTYLGDQLTELLPDGLAALTEERVVVENLREPRLGKSLVPDIAIKKPWDLHAPLQPGPSSYGGLAVAEPLVVMLDKPIDRCLHIVSGSGNLITAIEVLSPSNKEYGAGRQRYQEKQVTYQQGGVNLVEIDLLRGGERVFLAPPDHYGPTDEYPYGVSIWRAASPALARAYPIPLRDRLPLIPIPLREGDAEVVVDLQRVVDKVYRNGRYAVLMRYAYNPMPPLPGPDSEWAREILGLA